ncbi:MAG: hypothetical protein JWL59_4649 [Chthoniobacteraceae bacterium]|nr:hypothetical protein [Chthoniobacteraceae bacterium]
MGVHEASPKNQTPAACSLPGVSGRHTVGRDAGGNSRQLTARPNFRAATIVIPCPTEQVSMPIRQRFTHYL